MFFEFSRENPLRLIDRSQHALDLGERFEIALRNTATAWRQALDRRLRRVGVDRIGWMTITAAMQARSPLSQSALADALAVSHTAMVHAIDRLARGGFVKRESSTSDRRLKRVVVTEAGARLQSLLKDEVTAIRRQVLAIVEPEKIVFLTNLLEKLQEPLRSSSAPPRKANWVLGGKRRRRCHAVIDLNK
jgi:MarR family transcriptional regulator, transcriptional regulator for hemolysin